MCGSKGELVGARWESVDFEKKTWLIPLTDPVIQWFSDLQELAFSSAYVLPIRSRKKAVDDAHMEAVILNAASTSSGQRTFLTVASVSLPMAYA